MENFDYQSILVDSGSIVHWGTLKVPPWGLLRDSLGILGTTWGLFLGNSGLLGNNFGTISGLLWDYFWTTVGLLGIWGLSVGYFRTTWRLLWDFLGTSHLNFLNCLIGMVHSFYGMWWILMSRRFRIYMGKGGRGSLEPSYGRLQLSFISTFVAS